MNWLSTTAGLLAGMVGREIWEWLPGLTRVLIYVITMPLPTGRRQIRRVEWQGELPQFGQRRIAALLWVVALTPVCIWEATTAPGVLRRLGVAAPSLVLIGIGLTPFVCISLELSALLNLPLVVAVVLAVCMPPALLVVLLVGLFGWFWVMSSVLSSETFDSDSRISALPPKEGSEAASPKSLEETAARR